MEPRITQEHVAEWHKHGYVVVPDFLTPAELDAALANVADYTPTWDEYAARPQRYQHVSRHEFDFREFPYTGDALNDLTVHPDVVRFVKESLGTDEIALATSLLWAKYAGTFDFDQMLHADFRNNTLVYPKDEGIYRQVPFILYLTDVTEDLSPTWVVSQEVTGSDVDTVVGKTLTPESHEAAYREQHPVTVKAGSLLIYTMKTFHRGSAMTASAGARFSLHFVYRAAACQWMGWRAWARYGQDAEMIHFLTRATPEQRSLLGFPAPGHDYWDDETLRAVGLRYPGMDMQPYLDAARARDAG